MNDERGAYKTRTYTLRVFNNVCVHTRMCLYVTTFTGWFNTTKSLNRF